MAISIVHIGLPLDHPAIPAEDRPKIAQRLRELHERMTHAGYRYEIAHASPETGLEAFRHRLGTEPCDGVLIGGGVAGDPALSYFMEQIIDVTHEVAPQAKIMFYSHSVDVRTTIERWFGPTSADELAIRNLVDAWCRATEAGDVDALAPLMVDDMLFLAPGREPFGKRDFLEGARRSAGQMKVSVQAEVLEVRVAGDLGYCRLKIAATVTPPGGGPPVQHTGQTIGIYRREAGRWLLARDANLVV